MYVATRHGAIQNADAVLVHLSGRINDFYTDFGGFRGVEAAGTDVALEVDDVVLESEAIHVRAQASTPTMLTAELLNGSGVVVQSVGLLDRDGGGAVGSFSPSLSASIAYGWADQASRCGQRMRSPSPRHPLSPALRPDLGAWVMGEPDATHLGARAAWDAMQGAAERGDGAEALAQAERLTTLLAPTLLDPEQTPTYADAVSARANQIRRFGAAQDVDAVFAEALALLDATTRPLERAHMLAHLGGRVPTSRILSKRRDVFARRSSSVEHSGAARRLHGALRPPGDHADRRSGGHERGSGGRGRSAVASYPGDTTKGITWTPFFVALLRIRTHQARVDEAVEAGVVARDLLMRVREVEDAIQVTREMCALLVGAQRYEEAIPYAEWVVGGCGNLYGDDSQESGRAMYEWAYAMDRSGDLRTADGYYLRAREILDPCSARATASCSPSVGASRRSPESKCVSSRPSASSRELLRIDTEEHPDRVGRDEYFVFPLGQTLFSCATSTRPGSFSRKR